MSFEDGAQFTLSDVSENRLGWGPTEDGVPPQFKDIPFAPYSKSDRLGKIADWTVSDPKDGSGHRRDDGRFGRRYRGRLLLGVWPVSNSGLLIFLRHC